MVVFNISSTYIELHIRWCYTYCFNHQTLFRQFKRRRKVCCTYVFIHSIPSSFPMFQEFFFYHFLSLLCTAFNHSFRASLLCQVLIAFLFLRISWFLPHFWRIFSLNIASRLGSSFNTWNMLCHFLWSPWFLVRNHWFLNCFPPVDKVVFLSYCFQDFLLVWVLKVWL